MNAGCRGIRRGGRIGATRGMDPGPRRGPGCQTNDYFLGPFTATFSAAPALNAGTLAALILIASPVLGLRPARAARLRTSKVPKPTRATLSPFFSVLVTISISAAMLRSASALELPVLSAKASMSSFLFMFFPLVVITAHAASGSLAPVVGVSNLSSSSGVCQAPLCMTVWPGSESP